MAGEELAKLLGGKGNVVMLRYAVNSASTEDREAGFLDAMKKFPNIKIVSGDQYGSPTSATPGTPDDMSTSTSTIAPCTPARPTDQVRTTVTRTPRAGG